MKITLLLTMEKLFFFALGVMFLLSFQGCISENKPVFGKYISNSEDNTCLLLRTDSIYEYIENGKVLFTEHFCIIDESFGVQRIVLKKMNKVKNTKYCAAKGDCTTIYRYNGVNRLVISEDTEDLNFTRVSD